MTYKTTKCILQVFIQCFMLHLAKPHFHCKPAIIVLLRGNALLKPKRHSLRCHGFMVHAYYYYACVPMLYISELCEDCAIANEIDYAWASIHDNGHVITACDVRLQQRIKFLWKNTFSITAMYGSSNRFWIYTFECPAERRKRVRQAGTLTMWTLCLFPAEGHER